MLVYQKTMFDDLKTLEKLFEKFNFVIRIMLRINNNKHWNLLAVARHSSIFDFRLRAVDLQIQQWLSIRPFGRRV